MMLIVRMLDQARNMELQHSLIDLMETMCTEPYNVHQLLDREFVNCMIKYASLAHLNPDQIGNLLARTTANVLMLKEAGESSSRPAAASGGGERSGASATADSGGLNSSSRDLTEHEKALQHRRSLWIPDDIACPKTWFIAPKGPIPPPVQAQRGPFRVSDLLLKFDREEMDETFLVAPCTSEDLDEEKFEAVVDTGRWRPIQEYFQIRIQMLFPGERVDD